MQIEPGTISVSNSVSLAEWQKCGDATVIQGDTILPTTIHCPSTKVSYPNDLYIVTYDTESGDHGILGLFPARPSLKEIKGLIAARLPEEEGLPVGTNVYRVAVEPLPVGEA